MRFLGFFILVTGIYIGYAAVTEFLFHHWWSFALFAWITYLAIHSGGSALVEGDFGEGRI